jgi:hypothetical protein
VTCANSSTGGATYESQGAYTKKISQGCLGPTNDLFATFFIFIKSCDLWEPRARTVLLVHVRWIRRTSSFDGRRSVAATSNSWRGAHLEENI